MRNSYMSQMCIAITLLVSVVVARSAEAQCGHAQTSTQRPSAAFSTPPTSTTLFVLRQGTGSYLAGRQAGAHTGVDIIATALGTKRSDYEVRASGAGTIAYAMVND